MPRRMPCSWRSRGASGFSCADTLPRGSYTVLRMHASSWKTGAVDASRRAGASFSDLTQDRRGHVAPPRDEGREASRLAADHEEVDVLRARHDRDARLRVALVPDRQVA